MRITVSTDGPSSLISGLLVVWVKKFGDFESVLGRYV